MKLGEKIEIGNAAAVYACLLAVLLITLLVMWLLRKNLIVESWHRDSIVDALICDDNLIAQKGIDACNALIERQPGRMNIRLNLAAIYFRRQRYDDAAQIWKAVAEHEKAADEEKAWALVGLGACKFYAAPAGKRADAVPEAEKFFKQALEVKDGPDVRANLAAAASWRGEPAFGEVADHLAKAQAAGSVPSLACAQQINYLQGIVYSRQGNAEDAALAFDRAAALRPGWADVEKDRRMTELAMIVLPNVEPKMRHEMIERLAPQTRQFGDQQGAANNALGIAWTMLKDAPQFASQWYTSALARFELAVQAAPKDTSGYMNQVALLEDHIDALAKTLKGAYPGINAEGPLLPPNMDEEAKKKWEDDHLALVQIRDAIDAELKVLNQFLKDAAVTPELRLDGNLRKFACLRRVGWLMLMNDAVNRPGHFKHLVDLIDELLVEAPNEGQYYFVKGLMLIDLGEQPAALTVLKAAKAKGLDTPELNRLLAGLGETGGVVDVAPSPEYREFGTRPLLRVTLKTAASAFKEIKMQINSRDVAPTAAGSQVLYLMQDPDIVAGPNKGSVELIDPLGGTKTAEFEFFLDTAPPVWSLLPDPSQPVASQVIWTVTVSAPSGVQNSTLNLGIKSLSGSGADVIVIKDGTYRLAMPQFNVKAGDPAASPLRIKTAQDLPAGQYRLWIEAKSAAGNQLSDGKVFMVK